MPDNQTRHKPVRLKPVRVVEGCLPLEFSMTLHAIAQEDKTSVQKVLTAALNEYFDKRGYAPVPDTGEMLFSIKAL